MILAPSPVQQFLGNDGKPLAGGLLFTYVAGTTTKIATYTSDTGLSTNTNPIVLDFRGECRLWLDPTLTYKFTLSPVGDTDPPTKPIWTVDQVSGLGGLTQQIIGQLLYPRTAAEISVGVTPANYAYPPLHFLRYGITGSGSDESTTIQSALNVGGVNGGTLFAPKPTSKYGLGTTGVSVPANVVIEGDTCELVIYNYTGTGFAFTFVGGGNGLINAYVETTAAAGSALSFGNDCRRPLLRRVTVQSTFTPGSGRTGTGLSLTTTSSATTFSGNMLLEQFYVLGYKFGIDFNCFEIPLKTWTTVVGSQVFINGPGAGVCAGSRCIRMNATTNGVGTAIFGGTLEGCEAPIEIVSGGFGMSYFGDVEGNTSDVPILGASWNGEIVVHPAGTTYRAGTNQTVNRWFNERNSNGEWSRETWTNHYLDLYDSGGVATLTIARGASRIAGGSPTTKWQFTTGNSGADAGANRNYLLLPNGGKFCMGTGSPESVVTAPIGSLYGRDNGGAVTSFYVKESGTGNTGWVAK